MVPPTTKVGPHENAKLVCDDHNTHTANNNATNDAANGGRTASSGSNWSQQVHSECSASMLRQGHSNATQSDIADHNAHTAINNEVLSRYHELAALGNMPEDPKRVVVFAKHHLVTEIVNRGPQPIYKKQTQRAAPNPWRRYAPLEHIHEVGGWVNGTGNSKGNKKKDYHFVKPGTQPPPPPTNAVLQTLNTDVLHKKCELKLAVPNNCETSSEAAHAMALELAALMERRWADVLAADVSREIPTTTAVVDRRNDHAESPPGTSSSSAEERSGSAAQSVRNLLRKIFHSPRPTSTSAEANTTRRKSSTSSGRSNTSTPKKGANSAKTTPKASSSRKSTPKKSPGLP